MLLFYLFFVENVFIYTLFLAIYLCKREIEDNLNGDLLNFKVKKFAKAKVDFKNWEFEFQLADDQPKTYNNNVML